MVAFGLIYTFTAVPNPRVMKIQAAANFNHLELELTPDFTMRKDNKTPEFLADFPMGKVPTFRGADGLLLFESDAIAQYVAESGPARDQLLGSTVAHRALIRQWICWANNEIVEVIVPCILWRLGRRDYHEIVETTNLERLERALRCLEGHIQGRSWVAGTEKLSMADISIASALYWGFAFVIDQEMREKYPEIVGWYRRVIQSEGVKQAFGEEVFIAVRRLAPSG